MCSRPPEESIPGARRADRIRNRLARSKDGLLLSFAQDRFDVFVTVDRKLETQNDLSWFRLGFIVVRVPNNRLEAFEPIFRHLNDAASKVRRGEIIRVVSPGFEP